MAGTESHSLVMCLRESAAVLRSGEGMQERRKGGDFPSDIWMKCCFTERSNPRWGWERKECLMFPGMEAFSQSRFAGENIGAAERKLSVVIPSKDNPEILKRCIRSLMAEAAQEPEMPVKLFL